jgi:hypothetical protein
MDFLPSDYEAPKTSGYYMKLMDGENRIRILSRSIVGWEDWQDKKPIRFKMNEKPLKPVDPTKAIKHFWSFVVYNYNENEIQILQINQAGIRKAIENLSKDEDWGAPFFYDLKIMKKGEGKETEYAVNPVPHKPVDSAIENAFHNRPINLDALFENVDPFAKGYGKYEEFMCNHKIVEVPNQEGRINNAQFACLLKKLDLVPEYTAKVKMFLKEKGISDLREIDVESFERIISSADIEFNKLKRSA